MFCSWLPVPFECIHYNWRHSCTVFTQTVVMIDIEKIVRRIFSEWVINSTVMFLLTHYNRTNSYCVLYCWKWYYHTYTSISADIHLHPTIELVCPSYLLADVGILSQISWPVLIQSTIGHDFHIYRQQYSWRVQKQLAIAKIWVTDHD